LDRHGKSRISSKITSVTVSFHCVCAQGSTGSSGWNAEERELKKDIWALGCMHLEFIAWFIGGAEHLEEFQERRDAEGNGWDGERRVRVKRAVSEVSFACFLGCLWLGLKRVLMWSLG
jgi:hypothetical protein